MSVDRETVIRQLEELLTEARADVERYEKSLAVIRGTKNEASKPKQKTKEPDPRTVGRVMSAKDRISSDDPEAIAKEAKLTPETVRQVLASA